MSAVTDARARGAMARRQGVEARRQGVEARRQGVEARRQGVEARIWEALRHVEDPEIPVSVLGMGLIISVAYRPEDRVAALQITFTAMGCPATEFIQDDITEALLADPAIDAVEIEVVWDPVWTKDRIRADARETMRRLGIVV